MTAQVVDLHRQRPPKGGGDRYLVTLQVTKEIEVFAKCRQDAEDYAKDDFQSDRHDPTCCDVIDCVRQDSRPPMGKRGASYHCMECHEGRCFFRGVNLECPYGMEDPVFIQYIPPFRLPKAGRAVTP